MISVAAFSGNIGGKSEASTARTTVKTFEQNDRLLFIDHRRSFNNAERRRVAVADENDGATAGESHTGNTGTHMRTL